MNLIVYVDTENVKYATVLFYIMTRYDRLMLAFWKGMRYTELQCVASYAI